jgi:hypothetical protein
VSELPLVDLLIDGAEQVHAELVSGWLARLEFSLVDDRKDDRLVLGPTSKPYAARYRFRVWESPTAGRIVWFWLDSEIPHMSSIVACMAVPLAATCCPMFVMNLNLKLKAGTYNTIIGYRGSSAKLRDFRGVVPRPETNHGKVRPQLTKPNPQSFEGVRSMFWLDEAPILWSLDVVRKSLDRWFTAVVETDVPSRSTNLPCDPEYAQEMISLHGREGGVYDAVFGPGWLVQLFRDRVFQESKN